MTEALLQVGAVIAFMVAVIVVPLLTRYFNSIDKRFGLMDKKLDCLFKENLETKIALSKIDTSLNFIGRLTCNGKFEEFSKLENKK